MQRRSNRFPARLLTVRFLFLQQYNDTTSDRFRPFLEALEVVAQIQFIPG